MKKSVALACCDRISHLNPSESSNKKATGNQSDCIKNIGSIIKVGVRNKKADKASPIR